MATLIRSVEHADKEKGAVQRHCIIYRGKMREQKVRAESEMVRVFGDDGKAYLLLKQGLS